MQLTALNKEKLKKVMIVLATIALFLIVSILVIYQTQIFQI